MNRATAAWKCIFGSWRVCGKCVGFSQCFYVWHGKLPQEVIASLCDVQNGLFPGVKDIKFSCSCPDRASLCKHVAATLYAVGTRLDAEPELLFLLRQVDAAELLTPQAGLNAALSGQNAPTEDILHVDDLGALFGIELDRED